MSQETYKKDVDRGTFIVERAPILIFFILYGLCIYIAIVLFFHILFDDNFIVKDYLLRKSLLWELHLPFIVACIIHFLEERKTYRLLKEKPFATVTDDELILNFGKRSFPWDSIQSVRIEGERKLNVVYGDKKRKKRICDLKWLSGKREFISTLKNRCDTRKITCQESGMTLSSRVLLFLEVARQTLFER